MRITKYFRLSNNKVIYIEENDDGFELGHSKDIADYGSMVSSMSWICQISSGGVTVAPNSDEELEEISGGLTKKKIKREPAFEKICNLFAEKLKKSTIDEWKAYLKKIKLKSVSAMKAHQMLLLKDLVIIPDPGKIESYLVIPRQLADKILFLESLPG